MSCTVDIKNEKLYIKFNSLSKDVFYEKLDIVKSLHNRKYNPDSRVWTAQIVEDNIKILKESDFEFINKAEYLTEKDFNKLPERIMPDINEELLNEDLYPFQKEGVRFLEGRNGTGMILDQMGLGKTAQSLSYLKLHPELRPALVVCPCTLKLNWEKEIKIWIGEDEKVEILQGMKPYELTDSDIFIINYDILGKCEKITVNGRTRRLLMKGGWWEVLREKIKIVIADEVQYIANNKTARAKAFIQIKKKVKKFIALSGTPIKNRPSEFFTVLSMIEPKTFYDRWKYLHRYCNPKYNGFGYDFKGLTNGKELFRTIYPLMIRRNKKDVLKDLPEKTIITVPLECDKNDYEKYMISYKEIFKKDLKSKLQMQNEIEFLKQLAYTAKRNFVIKWIKDFLDTGEKLVLFGYHIKVLDDIQKEFPDSVRIDGGVKLKDREKAVEDFQNGKAQLFIGQIQAAGVGITLTAASSCVFVEFGWSPSDHDQASDRIHRIGQESDAVFVYYLIADGTIENEIVKLLQEKSKTVGKVLDGKEKNFFDEDIYEELMKGIKK
jgi:SWI/SNF-related matrix-associated actin-dependent regulator 1 of chromatin subfamily A